MTSMRNVPQRPLPSPLTKQERACQRVFCRNRELLQKRVFTKIGNRHENVLQRCNTRNDEQGKFISSNLRHKAPASQRVDRGTLEGKKTTRIRSHPRKTDADRTVPEYYAGCLMDRSSQKAFRLEDVDIKRKMAANFVLSSQDAHFQGTERTWGCVRFIIGH